MRQRLIIGVGILLLLSIIGLMVWDFYYQSADEGNPYEYKLDDLKKISKSEICYRLSGQIDPGMEGAYALAMDENDRVFVGGNQKLNIFDVNGDLADVFEISGRPTCLAVHPDGEIYAGMKSHVEVYGPKGDLLMMWPEMDPKTNLTSIAVEGESVFVADAGNKIVYHFNRNGELMNTIGEKDPEAGFNGFIIPSPHFDLAIGREGQLWVVNPGKHEFLAFNKNGEQFSSWSRTSMQLEGFSGCCNPGNIALLPDGSFVTSEKGIERVKIHLPSGDYKCVVAGPDQFDSGTTHLDLVVNSEGRIYVLDAKSGIVKFFEEN